MKFEWDEFKRVLNLRKHGVDFTDVKSMFAQTIVTALDERYDDGEEHLSLGLVNGLVLVVAHTETDEVIPIISARKATKYEERSYFSESAH
jgi:uncharacterized protein